GMKRPGSGRQRREVEWSLGASRISSDETRCRPSRYEPHAEHARRLSVGSLQNSLNRKDLPLGQRFAARREGPRGPDLRTDRVDAAASRRPDATSDAPSHWPGASFGDLFALYRAGRQPDSDQSRCLSLGARVTNDCQPSVSPTTSPPSKTLKLWRARPELNRRPPA